MSESAQPQKFADVAMPPSDLETTYPSGMAADVLESSSLREEEDEKGSSQTEINSDENANLQVAECEEIEAEIGITNIFRLASRWAEGEEKEEYREYASSALQEVLGKAPNNINVLLEKGWWLLDQRPEEAEDFFSCHVEQYPHILGLRLGQLRAKSAKGEKGDPQQWGELTDAFSVNSTIINLEYGMQELLTGNGTTLGALEKLRKQIRREDVKQLPRSIQGSEKWAAAMVRQSLFGEIDVDNALTENDLPHISDNYKNHEATLKGIVEQCLSVV